MINVIKITRLSIYTSASPDFIYKNTAHKKVFLEYLRLQDIKLIAPATLSRQLNTRKQSHNFK